jgi:general stress protein YciG
MREDSLKNRNVVPIGSREWRELRASQEPNWLSLLPEATKPEFTCKPSIPNTVHQHMREAGRRGGLQRSRNYARRSPRCWTKFCRQYGHTPNGMTAALVKANPEVQQHLRTYASLGGKARAARHSHEELAAIAAKGGRAKAEKAAKLKQAALCSSAVAAKQVQE